MVLCFAETLVSHAHRRFLQNAAMILNSQNCLFILDEERMYIWTQVSGLMKNSCVILYLNGTNESTAEKWPH